jgi:TolA-binding protein
MDEQEAQYRKKVQDYPDSPLAHFALGRYLLERARYQDAAVALAEANRLQPQYLAAMVALGDAQKGAGQVEQARETFEQAHQVALVQKHLGFAQEIEERIADL